MSSEADQRKLQYNGCAECANATSRCEFHQFYQGDPDVDMPDAELANCQCFYNCYRPHESLKQLAPMESHSMKFNQTAPAA